LGIEPSSPDGLAANPDRRIGPGFNQTTGPPPRTPSAPTSLRLQ
jgi:hypothetical protein